MRRSLRGRASRQRDYNTARAARVNKTGMRVVIQREFDIGKRLCRPDVRQAYGKSAAVPPDVRQAYGRKRLRPPDVRQAYSETCGSAARCADRLGLSGRLSF